MAATAFVRVAKSKKRISIGWSQSGSYGIARGQSSPGRSKVAVIWSEFVTASWARALPSQKLAAHTRTTNTTTRLTICFSTSPISLRSMQAGIDVRQVQAEKYKDYPCGTLRGFLVAYNPRAVHPKTVQDYWQYDPRASERSTPHARKTG